MGSYDAQLTSSNVLLMHELRLLLQDIMIEKVRCYSRYIDDGFCVIFGNYTDVLNVIDTINRQLPTTIPIELSIKKSQTHFLDLWITIDYETFRSGRLGHKIYQRNLILILSCVYPCHEGLTISPKLIFTWLYLTINGAPSLPHH